MTFARLWTFLAVALPVLAALLAPMSTVDLAYQVRAGDLMLGNGSILRVDPFTFTAAGAPWLDQQWGAQVVLAAVFSAFGWAGLAVLRAVLVGVTMGLLYLACRLEGAGQRVAAWLTLAGFVVSAIALGLRPQLFGMVLFAAVLAILAGRRRWPRSIWLIPLLTIAWANLHGSFFLAPAAVGVAWLEEVVAQTAGSRRLAIVGLASLVATLVGPFGGSVWPYSLGIATDPVIRRIVTEWQPTSPLSAIGVLLYGSAGAAILVVTDAWRRAGRAIATMWPRIVWLAALLGLAVVAQRGVAWWALAVPVGVAAIVARAGHGTERVSPPRPVPVTERGGRANLLLAGTLVVTGFVLLPIWRPSDPIAGPAGLLVDAPIGVATRVAQLASPADRVWNAQAWGSWLELTAPRVPVAVDSRIEVIPTAAWNDLVALNAGAPDWPAILDRWGVTIVVAARDEQALLLPLLRADAHWRIEYEDRDGAIFVRAGR